MHSSALARTHGQMENWRDKGENKGISISLKNMCQTPNYAQILMKFFCMISSLLHLLLEEAHSKKKKKKSGLPVNKLSLVAMFPPPAPLQTANLGRFPHSHVWHSQEPTRQAPTPVGSGEFQLQILPASHFVQTRSWGEGSFL